MRRVLFACVAAALFATRDARAEPFGVGVDLGMGMPTHAEQSGTRGATSLLVDGRATLDVASFVQLALAVWAFLPGIATSAGNESYVAGAGTVDARFFGRVTETLYAVGGVSAGYAFTQVTSTQCNAIGICSTRDVEKPDGLLLAPFGGLRWDVATAPRRVSLYAEIGWQETLGSSSALDRVYAHVGPWFAF